MTLSLEGAEIEKKKKSNLPSLKQARVVRVHGQEHKASIATLKCRQIILNPLLSATNQR